MTVSPVSTVTGALLSAAMDLHPVTNHPSSRFPVCACGHSSMEVYRPRHLREVIQRSTGALLIPTPLLGDPAEHAMSLISALLVRADDEQRASMQPLTLTAKVLFAAYAPADDIPLLDPDALVLALGSTLNTHSVADMTIGENGVVRLRCLCGHLVDEDLHESHRAAEASKAGCVYATRDELVATWRTFGELASAIPDGLMVGLRDEAEGLFHGLTRLRRHVESVAR